MADERDATQAARRSGDAASPDLPDLSDSGLADCDDDEASSSSAGWMRSGVWAGAILALLMFYFLLLPVGIIYLEENTRFFDHTSSSADTAIEVFLVPIFWLDSNVAVYENYLSWIDSKMP